MMISNIVRRSLELLRLIPRSQLVAQIQGLHPSPDQLRPRNLIIVRDGSIDKWICFSCPCGCGVKIQLSMDMRRRPRWSVKVDWLGRPTLDPSIRRLDDCRCHFWVKRGQIVWCADSGKEPDFVGESSNRLQ